MKCFEEAAIVFAFASATRKAGPKHRKRMRPVFLIRVDMASGLRLSRSPMNHA